MGIILAACLLLAGTAVWWEANRYRGVNNAILLPIWRVVGNVRWGFQRRVAELFPSARAQAFYGVLRDQHGNGLSNATVNYYVTGPGRMPKNEWVRTDGSGYFVIKKAKGGDVTITPEAAGHVFQGPSTHHWTHRGSKESPVVVPIWKLAGPERLVWYSVGHKIPIDRREIHFDALRGEIVEAGGDFKISANFVGEDRGVMIYGCDLKIEPVDGSIQRTSEKGFWNTFTAPKGGYTNYLQGGHKPGMASGQDFVFAISRAGAVFSKLCVSVASPFGREREWTLHVSGFVNGNGSGNWEVDWKKVDRKEMGERAIIDATGVIGHDLETLVPTTNRVSGALGE